MSAKQQHLSRIQWAAKPLLILLPLICGTVLISRGRRTQTASSVTVQQDTGQYRSGRNSGAQEASFNYFELEYSVKGLVFHYTPSDEALTGTQMRDEAKQLFKTTPLYKFVIKPCEIKLPHYCFKDVALERNVMITSKDVMSGLCFGFKPPVEYFHQEANSQWPNHVAQGWHVWNPMIKKSLQVRGDSKFTIEQLKDSLGQTWRSLKDRNVSQTSKQCIVTIYTADNKIYLAEKDNFRLIESNGDLSSERVNKIKTIVQIFAIRLKDDASPPLGFNIDNAIEIDLEKSHGTGRVFQNTCRGFSCICSSGDED